MTSAPFVPVRVSLPLVPSMVAVRLLQLAVAWATGAITNDPTITATPATRRQRPPGAIHTEWSGIAADKLLATSGHGPYTNQATAIAAILSAADNRPRLPSPPETIADTIARAIRARRPKTRTRPAWEPNHSSSSAACYPTARSTR